MAREIGIVRDNRSEGCSGWRVRLQRGSIQLTNKFFSDVLYGGDQQISLLSARAHRNEVAAKNGVKIIKRTNTSLYTKRLQLKMTQSQAAASLGISLLTYSRTERISKGYRPGLDHLLDFCSKNPALGQFSPSCISDVLDSINGDKPLLITLLRTTPKTLDRWMSANTAPSGINLTILLAAKLGFDITLLS